MKNILNYLSYELVQMVACFCNFCVTESKKDKNLNYMMTSSKMTTSLLQKYDVTSHLFP